MSSGNVMERCCASGAGIAAERAEEAALAAQKAAKSVAEAVDLAADAVEIARNAERILDMDTTAEALETGEPPTVEYDKIANVMHFGLPKGNTGDKGDQGPPPNFRGRVTDPALLPMTGNTEGDLFFVGNSDETDARNGDLYVWRNTAQTWVLAVNLRGPSGRGINIVDTLDSADQLPIPGTVGDDYLVDGDLYTWSEAEQAWKNQGRIQGPAGTAGVAEIFFNGPPRLSSSTLPPGEFDGAMGYAHPLGVYRFHLGGSDTPDGELVIGATDESGVWHMVLPGTEALFGLAQATTDQLGDRLRADLTAMADLTATDFADIHSVLSALPVTRVYTHTQSSSVSVAASGNSQITFTLNGEVDVDSAVVVHDLSSSATPNIFVRAWLTSATGGVIYFKNTTATATTLAGRVFKLVFIKEPANA